MLQYNARLEVRNGFIYSIFIWTIKSARGLINKEININNLDNDFYKWLEQYKNNCINYASLLFSSDINFINPNTAEVNKGNYDSIALPYDTTIISPYIEETVNNNVVNCKFDIRRGLPVYKNFQKNIYRYITHNPYSNFSEIDLINWRYMHEFTDFEIVFGMFGSLYDEDKKKKIEKLELLKKCIIAPFIVQYDTVNDSYYYFLASKTKKRIL